MPSVFKKKKNLSPIKFKCTSDDEYSCWLKEIPVDEKNVFRLLKAFGKKIPRDQVEFELERDELVVEGVALEKPIVKDYLTLIVNKVKWVDWVESKLPVRVLSKKVNSFKFTKKGKKYRVNIEINGVYTNKD